AQILHLLERLPHADEADSAAGRIEDRIGQLPPKLLGNFVAHRLLSLDAEWLLETRDVEPALGLLALIHDLGAIADQSVDECDARAVLLAFHTVRNRNVLRHEDVRLDTGGSTIGCERARSVAGGWDSDLANSVRLAHRHRGAQPTRLERACGIQPLVLDVHVRIMPALDHRRKTFAEC